MTRTLQIANGIALVFTILFNYLSNTGVFNGKTIGNVSDEYHNLFTPAGYAFSIWGLIYILLFAFVIYTGRSLFKPEKNESETFVNRMGWWFVVSCIANCLWIVTWLYGYTGLSVLVLAAAFISLMVIVLEALKYYRGSAEKWFINIPFQIYAGWLSVALIAAAASWLQKIGWEGFGLSEEAWTVIMITVAVAVHLFMTWQKRALAFALVAVWALVAIAVSNHDINYTVYAAALVAALIIAVSSVIFLLKRRAFGPR